MDLPVSCTLTPSELSRRRDDLLPGLLARALERRDVAGGFQYRFSPSTEMLHAIIRAIDAERICCRFFRFQLTVEPDEGPVYLEITGPAGVREMLDALSSGKLA